MLKTYLLRKKFCSFLAYPCGSNLRECWQRRACVRRSAARPLFQAELARHGYDLSPGTLYPLLHSLEEQGYLVHTDRLVEGQVRKYYVITEGGRAALLEAKQKIAELVHEALEEEDGARLPELPLSSYDEAEER